MASFFGQLSELSPHLVIFAWQKCVFATPGVRMHHGSPSTDVAQAVNSFGSRVYLLRPVVICQAQAAEGIHETVWLHLAVFAVGKHWRGKLAVKGQDMFVRHAHVAVAGTFGFRQVS